MRPISKIGVLGFDVRNELGRAGATVAGAVRPVRPPATRALSFLVLCSLFMGTMIAPGSAVRAATPDRPAVTAEVAGMIDVGDHRLFAACMGAGQPTVLLQNGYGMGWEHWIDVQQEIAKVTRVCAFDRAGFGMSDPAPSLPLTAADIVEDTHALVTALHEPGPYVLAGFSIGGLVSRLYASTYPGEVAGLVLIEATPPEWLDQTLVGMTAEQRGDAYLRLSGRDPGNPGSPDPNAPEAIDFLTSAAQVRCEPAVKAMPVVSIVATSSIVGPGEAADAANGLWQRLQANQSAALGATQVAAHARNHNVLATEPELIVSAILQVIGDARATDIQN